MLNHVLIHNNNNNYNNSLNLIQIHNNLVTTVTTITLNQQLIVIQTLYHIITVLLIFQTQKVINTYHHQFQFNHHNIQILHRIVVLKCTINWMIFTQITMINSLHHKIHIKWATLDSRFMEFSKFCDKII